MFKDVLLQPSYFKEEYNLKLEKRQKLLHSFQSCKTETTTTMRNKCSHKNEQAIISRAHKPGNWEIHN